MKVLLLFTLAVILGNQIIAIAGTCQSGQLGDCEQPDEKCKNLLKRQNCISKIVETCKDDKVYEQMKKQLNKTNTSYSKKCGCVGVTSSFVLILSACLLSMWFRK